MLGCDAADLVAIAKYGNDQEDEIVVTRVNLDERPYQHRKHWFEIVVPRLYKVSSVVKMLRLDENARRKFVTCDDAERWTILAQYLGYLNLNDYKEYHTALKRREPSELEFQRNIELALQYSLLENTRKRISSSSSSDMEPKKKKEKKKRTRGIGDEKNIHRASQTRSGCVYNSPIKKE